MFSLLYVRAPRPLYVAYLHAPFPFEFQVQNSAKFQNFEQSRQLGSGYLSSTCKMSETRGRFIA